jgi:hypothetical protein
MGDQINPRFGHVSAGTNNRVKQEKCQIGLAATPDERPKGFP